MSRDFLSLVNELSMLSPELAEQLTAEVARTGESPETLIARRGLLSAVQMDIVQTLLRPTDAVPGYELLTALGHGGMGVVYRAKQKTLDRVVAIKTILVNQMTDRSMAARFEQEARAVARLKHPNIISAIDFGQHDGRLFFVMELVEGEDLESLIERQQQSGSCCAAETLAWSLARQTASGLAHAAELGIVHRDIKPANLLLVEPTAGFPLPPGMPLVKIADFGLAFLATSEAEARTRLTSANTTVGSPHYIAPEQITGEQVDARADIYSLGATLFHLLAGHPPYSGRPMMQILSQKMATDAPRLRSVRADISDATDTLIAAMMARRPEDRVASYSELLGRIEEVWRSLNTATLAELPLAALTLTADLPRQGRPTSTAELAQPRSAVRTDALEAIEPGRDTGTLGATQPMPAATSHARRSRRAWLGLAGVAVLGAGAWGLVAKFKNAAPAQPRLVPGGWSEPLFNGRSLRNWQTRSGTWVLTEDEDGAKVLAGTNGVISRRLLRGDEQPLRLLKHFEVSLAVRLHQATAVEIHFGLFARPDENPPRPGIRLENNTAGIVFRSADRDKSAPLHSSVTLPAINHEQPRIIRLRRDATHWFATVDGLSVGSLGQFGPGELAEFRLSVEDGPAWFSDIEVEELVEPPASSTSK